MKKWLKIAAGAAWSLCVIASGLRIYSETQSWVLALFVVTIVFILPINYWLHIKNTERINEIVTILNRGRF